MSKGVPIRLGAPDPSDPLQIIDGTPPVRDDDPYKPRIPHGSKMVGVRIDLADVFVHAGLGPRERTTRTTNVANPAPMSPSEVFARLEAIEGRGDLEPAQLRLRTDLACLRAISQILDQPRVQFDESIPPNERENLLALRNTLALHLYGMQIRNPADAEEQGIEITTEEQTLKSFETYIKALRASELVDESTLVSEMRSLLEILVDQYNIRRIKMTDASIRRACLMSPEMAVTDLAAARSFGDKVLSVFPDGHKSRPTTLHQIYTVLAEKLLTYGESYGIPIIIGILLRLRDKHKDERGIIDGTIYYILELLPEDKTKRILLEIIDTAPPPDTHAKTVVKAFGIIKGELDKGISAQNLLGMLKNNQFPYYRVAYWILLDLFEEAKGEFLTTQKADSAGRKARRELPKGASEKAILERTLTAGEEEIRTAVLKKINSVEETELARMVEEIISAETIAITAGTAISANIESDETESNTGLRDSLIDLAKSRESGKLSHVVNKYLIESLNAILIEFEIRQLEYELRECPLREETRTLSDEKLTELKQKRETYTDRARNFGMRIIKHTIIRTHEKSAQIKDEDTAAREIGTEDEITSAIKLLEDKGRDGEKFARNFMFRTEEGALHILRQTGPSIRRCTIRPFDLYKIREACKDKDDITRYRNLVKREYEFIFFDIVDIDLFDPPLEQHIPCLIKVVIEHLSHSLKNIFDNPART